MCIYAYARVRKEGYQVVNKHSGPSTRQNFDLKRDSVPTKMNN